MVAKLRRHLKAVLIPGICVDATSGGWKLSSSSENTWMSKIFLCQFVAERILGVTLPDSYDAAHAIWQRDGESRDHAFTDQVHSTTGADLGSRYYPRGVTGLLWML
jgi:xylan 1,4-beta-xylosidase